jgi:hypothetical protein
MKNNLGRLYHKNGRFPTTYVRANIRVFAPYGI